MSNDSYALALAAVPDHATIPDPPPSVDERDVAQALEVMKGRGFDYLDAAYAVVSSGAKTPNIGIGAWPAFVAAVKAANA